MLHAQRRSLRSAATPPVRSPTSVAGPATSHQQPPELHPPSWPSTSSLPPSRSRPSPHAEQRAAATEKPLPLEKEPEEAAPRNPVGVQLLSRRLHAQLFPPGSSTHVPPLHPHAVPLSRSHLSAHGLDPSQASTLSEVNFPLPPLQGKDLSEHFLSVGREVGGPWIRLAHQLAGANILPPPEGCQSPSAPHAASGETTTTAAKEQGEEEAGLCAEDWLALPPALRHEIHVRQPKWLRQPGWVRYPVLRSKDGEASALGQGHAVGAPLAEDGSLVFDVETMSEHSPYAVMATAAGENAWYAWLSPWLLGEGEGKERQDHLIPFTDGRASVDATQSPPPRLVVGHNVGYDRARIRDEYSLRRGSIRFLDTMALHVATHGISSPQRPAWMKHAKAREQKLLQKVRQRQQLREEEQEALRALLGGDGDGIDAEDLQELDLDLDGIEAAAASNPGALGNSLASADQGDGDGASSGEAAAEAAATLWQDVTSKNSLVDVAALHCGIQVPKHERSAFTDGTPRHEILARLDSLLGYCANDVAVTHAIFRKVWPAFVAACPHPVTTAGVMGLGNSLLPVDDEWDEYKRRCEEKYEEGNAEVRGLLVQLAESLRRQGTGGISWDQAAELAAARAATDDAEEEGSSSHGEADAVSPRDHAAAQAASAAPTPLWSSDPWASQLDWSPKRPKAAKRKSVRVAEKDACVADDGASAGAAASQDDETVPRWYKQHFVGAGATGVGVRSSAAPAVLMLRCGDARVVRGEGGKGWALVDARGRRSAMRSGPLAKAFLKTEAGCEMVSDAGEHGEEALEAIRRGESDDVVRAHIARAAEDVRRRYAEPGSRAAHEGLAELDWSPVVAAPAAAAAATATAAERAAPDSEGGAPWWPKWYWDLYKSATGQLELTIRSKIAPLLLRISWQGCPLYHSREHGWTFCHRRADRPDLVTRQKPLSFGHAADARLRELLLSSQDDEGRRVLAFYKVPHTAGDDSNVGSPFSKSFLPFFGNGTLRSEHPDEAGQQAARSALELNAQCSYWIGVRDRVERQMVVWDGQGGSDMGFAPGISGARLDDESEARRRKGLILPQTITMGTVTRRAIERTWLTASNAKKNRVGSELKAMVKAPPGWVIVGADVDSEELWICSVMGDAQFGFHGATAVGWMTLEGTKALGTDLHSKTASILGTSRNDAKVFNYSRIYGAGVRHATQLLLKADPTMRPEDATQLAKKLYASTKGASTNTPRLFGRRFWHGGSESFVFNKLEEVATSERPRTPALDCGITAALSKRYLPGEAGGAGANHHRFRNASGGSKASDSSLGSSDYMPSRINWVVQSSGVDYLHMLVVSMEWLCSRYGIEARFMLSVHDEVRYLAREADAARTALALQVANLWTRAMFAHRLQMDDLPQGVAFFAQVDVDRVLRKEADDACVTPSQPRPIPPGEAIEIEETLRRTGGGNLGQMRDAPSSQAPPQSRTSSERREGVVGVEEAGHAPTSGHDAWEERQQHRALGEAGFLFLQAQASDNIHEIRRLDELAREAAPVPWDDGGGEGARGDATVAPPRTAQKGGAAPRWTSASRNASRTTASAYARNALRPTATALQASRSGSAPRGRASMSTSSVGPTSSASASLVSGDAKNDAAAAATAAASDVGVRTEEPGSDAFGDIMAALPARPRRAHKPFFRTAAHRSLVQWRVYRPLLRACPTSMPEISSMIRGLTRAKRRVTSPAQTEELLRRAQDLLYNCLAAREGDEEAQASLQAIVDDIRRRRHAEAWERSFDRYMRSLWPPKRPRPSGALLPPSLFNPPLPRYKPVQPVALTMMHKRRREARQRRLLARFDVEETARAVRDEVGIATRLVREQQRQRPRSSEDAEDEGGQGGEALHAWVDARDWMAQVEERRRSHREATARDVARSQMVFPTHMLLEAKRARKAKHRWRLACQYRNAQEERERRERLEREEGKEQKRRQAELAETPQSQQQQQQQQQKRQQQKEQRQKQQQQQQQQAFEKERKEQA